MYEVYDDPIPLGTRIQTSVKERQYGLAWERDRLAGMDGLCVLCRIGVPAPEGVGTLADDYHEIESKADLPGPANLERLYRLPNIAPACRYHHDAFQHLPLIWMAAMVETRLAKPEDYADSPDWRTGMIPFVTSQFSVISCFGHWGYGTQWFLKEYGQVPGSVTMVYVHTGDDIDDFCSYCCPRRGACVVSSKRKSQE